MLRVLCVIESGTWVEPHIVGSLRAMGHAVEVFFYGSGIGEFYGVGRRRERFEKNRALLDAATMLRDGSGLDLIFCYVYDDFLLEKTARSLQLLDVPMVNYNVDMVNQWYRQTLTARYFTRMLCAQLVNMEQLARYNPRVLHFPMAAKSRRFSTQNEDAEVPDALVTFVGTPMTYRVRMLSRLHRQGVPLAIYGKYWQEGLQATATASVEKTFYDLWHYTAPKVRAEGAAGLVAALRRRILPVQHTLEEKLPETLYKGFIPELALASFFRRSAINLGFTRIAGDDPDAPGVTQLKLRDFEVPQAGGFYLVERTAEYAGYFRLGTEVETWGTPSDLIEKIRYYLGHDSERRAIALAGQVRANAEHTWDTRFAALFSELGLRA